MEKLKGCFEATKWDLFLNDQDCQNNYELLNNTIISYINFCVDSVIKTKEVTISPNDKPWVNKELISPRPEEKGLFAEQHPKSKRVKQGDSSHDQERTNRL